MLSSSAHALRTSRGHQRTLDAARAGQIDSDYVLVGIARSVAIRQPADREQGTSSSLRIYSAPARTDLSRSNGGLHHPPSHKGPASRREERLSSASKREAGSRAYGVHTLSDRMCPHISSPSPKDVRSSRNSSSASLLYSLPSGHDTTGSCKGRCKRMSRALYGYIQSHTPLTERRRTTSHELGSPCLPAQPRLHLSSGSAFAITSKRSPSPWCEQDLSCPGYFLHHYP